MYDFVKGEVLLFDKNLDWTSFDLVSKVRVIIKKQAGQKVKVGHAGTLDPLASGLVIICTGKMTKSIDAFQKADKEYEAVLRFGATTPSFDLETPIDVEYPYEHITQESLNAVLKTFTGKIDQTPPLFSAKKVNGQRAYIHARKGDDIEMKPVEIEIETIELLDFEPPFAKIRIVCSKGTYIRSLAHDIGRANNSGAHLYELRRTRIGDFKIENAITVEEFQKALTKA